MKLLNRGKLNNHACALTTMYDENNWKAQNANSPYCFHTFLLKLVRRVYWYIKAVSPPFWMIIFILITWMLGIVLFLRKRNRTFIILVYLQSKQRDDRTDQEESVDASLHMRHSVAIPYPTPQKSLTMQVGLLSKGTTSPCSWTMKWPPSLPRLRINTLYSVNSNFKSQRFSFSIVHFMLSKCSINFSPRYSVSLLKLTLTILT